MMERIETTILRNLIHNEEYSRKVIPFIEPDYFDNRSEKVIFEEITQFIVKYGNAITTEALNIEVENRTDLNEGEIKDTRDICNSFNDSPVDHQWLLDSTEKWCRDRAIYLALMEAIGIADGQDEKRIGMRFQVFCQMLWQFPLIIILDMITYKTTKNGMTTTIRRKTRFLSISNISTKSRKVVYLTRLLMSRSLVQASASLYSCATKLAPCCSKDGTFSTLQWRWQKRRLLNELTQTF